MGWIKWIPVVGQVVSGIAWAVNVIKGRKKNGRMTDAERDVATAEAKARADRILADVEKARGK